MVVFVRSGAIRINNNVLWFSGANGSSWSSWSYSNSSSAYDLAFDSADVNPADSSGHFNGLPLRCLAS